jgi:DNA topoisomerase-3
MGNPTRLILAEKQSQAIAIAEFLAREQGVQIREDDLTSRFVGDDVIIAANGHIYEDYAPDDYDPRYKDRSAALLPIIPAKWMKKPKTTRNALRALEALRRYVGDVQRVLHACDYDREGQLIGDEIFHDFKVKVPIDRLPIVGFDDDSIREAFSKVHANDMLRSLSAAALARSRADWLWGMNLSRLYSSEAEKKGYRDGIAIGRVISPTLYLLLRRERTIQEFVPLTHYEIKVAVNSRYGPFAADWVKPEHLQDGFDDKGRLVRRAVAEEIARRIDSAKIARVLTVVPGQRETPPPLPFSLSSLQVVASEKFKYTAKQVHEAAEALYDRHFLITYPRAMNVRHYPVSLHGRAREALETIRRNLPSLAPLIDDANPDIRSEAFNDQEVAAAKASHHAIAPLKTLISNVGDRLSKVEIDIYELICQYYIAQFYPSSITHSRKYTLVVNQDVLSLSASTISDPGWRPVLGRSDGGAKQIVELEPGTDLSISYALPQSLVTKPPAQFTDGKLIAALNDVGAHVDLPELKQRLGKNARLGSESTQTETIERLIAKKLVSRDRDHHLVPTELGMAVAGSLPKELQGPALTVEWERDLDRIANGEGKAADFLGGQVTVVTNLVALPPDMVLFDGWKPKARRDDTGGNGGGGRQRTSASAR